MKDRLYPLARISKPTRPHCRSRRCLARKECWKRICLRCRQGKKTRWLPAPRLSGKPGRAWPERSAGAIASIAIADAIVRKPANLQATGAAGLAGRVGRPSDSLGAVGLLSMRRLSELRLRIQPAESVRDDGPL